MLFAPVRIGWMDINLEAIATFFFSRVELPYNNGSIFHDEPPAAEEGKENWSDIGKKSRGLRYRINQSSSSSFSSSSFSSSVRKYASLRIETTCSIQGRRKKERKKGGKKKGFVISRRGLHEDSIFPDALRANMKTRLFGERDSGEKKKEKKEAYYLATACN